MTVETPTDLQVSDFNDALDVVRVAIALGMPVPIIPGMTMYSAAIIFGDSDEGACADLGVFPTREEALAAARNWVIWEWINTDTGPWYDGDWGDDLLPDEYEKEVIRRTDEYLSTTSDIDVVDTYFTQDESDQLEINQITVSAEKPIRSLADMGL